MVVELIYWIRLLINRLLIAPVFTIVYIIVFLLVSILFGETAENQVTLKRVVRDIWNVKR